MGSTLALLSLLLFAQATPVEFTIVTVPIDSRFDLPLSPSGEVEVRLDETVSRLKVKVERIQPFAAFGPLLRSYVVWAVTPEGEFENVGELEVDRQKAELETATTLQRFGILITAEPHFMVDRPSSTVAFTSRPPRHDEIRVESSSVETGFTNYSQISLPPQGALPPRVTQARMAFKVAEGEGAEKLADAAFRQARVAVDSMEQLLRRNMPLEVLLPYANDAIRLAHRATKLARAQPIIDELNEVTGRADALERERQRLEQEVQRITQRRRDTEERLDQTRSELVAAEREGRQLDLEKEEALRRARSAELEVVRLEQLWPPLERALIENGARQTACGLLVTLSGNHFDPSKATLKPETRETLARYVGVITFILTPTIRIEGHTDDSGPEDKNLTLSQDRAAAVREFFVQAGVPEDNIYSEGFGSARPVVPNEDAETRALNRRVEILFREP